MENAAERAPRRVSGLALLFGIVVLGLATGSAYYMFQRPRLEREREAILAAAPTTAEGRLSQWFTYGAPQIHHRLAQFARFSSDHPWLVTHRVPGGPDELPMIWGVACDELPQDLARIEDLTVVVELPEPRPLGRVPLDESQARHVPTYPAEEQVPGTRARAEARLVDLATYFLERLPEALEREIPGARIEIRVVPRVESSGRASD